MADVVIAGAGPVGLLAALAAAKNGLSVILLERNLSRPQQSRAIGITPPTLGIFERLGIAQQMISQGAKVSRAGAYSTTRKLCTVNFSGLKTTYPFVLAIPQDRTEALLENAVVIQPNIRFFRGFDVKECVCENGLHTVRGVDVNNQPFDVKAHFVIGCDGAKSVVRNSTAMNTHFCGAAYPHTFVMADYVDCTGWGDEARLYFTPRGSVESFPLPEGYRRFVLRTSCFVKDNPADFLVHELPLRCGVSLDTAKPRFESAFGVQHFKASSFARPNLFLCGDAAHVMSPIGGQNMNTGFADAELAAFLIAALHKGTVQPEVAAKVYDRYRKKAANAATQRAALMMRAGTSGGMLWNWLRNATMSIALRTPITSLLYGMFTMLSIPNRDLPSMLPRLKREFQW